jgi:hypothetical protein
MKKRPNRSDESGAGFSTGARGRHKDLKLFAAPILVNDI